MATFGLIPGWLRQALAALRTTRKKTLVVLFQRGAADGLNIVVPFRDPIYVRSRPSIKQDDPTREKGVIDLDSQFGLHHNLKSLIPLWKEGRFAIVNAVGSPNSTRSHFDAQDYMESGTPGVKNTEGGWLNRALELQRKKDVDQLEAVAIAQRLPLTLRGTFPALALKDIQSFSIRADEAVATSFETMYEQTIDALLSSAGENTRATMKILKGLPKPSAEEREKMGYPKGPMGRDFSEMARLIKAQVGLKVGLLELGGWDHHTNEQRRLANLLGNYGQTISAFYRDIGDLSEDVLLVTMTEFGRTVQENGNQGTDHGHASIMFLFGGKVKGGKIFGRWPGLEKENLFEGRDLQVTTDFRQVLSDTLKDHMGIDASSKVFPGFRQSTPVGLF